MIQITLTSFDLKQIADSGQCFRMLPAGSQYIYRHQRAALSEGLTGRPDRDLLL